MTGRVHVEGIGLFGPGLESWSAAVAVLAGRAAHVPTVKPVPPPPLLPPNERRRAVQTVRLALTVAAEAFAHAGRSPAETAAVFTSSGGDGETIHEILTTLASPAPELSPTRFHNSVHNAPAGYWSIAAGSRAPCSSLCCYDQSFAAGLLEAVAQVAAERCAVALIAYDIQYPEPLHSVRPIGAAFGVALVLAPEKTEASFAQLDLALGERRLPETRMDGASLEALREGTPAARALPLLAALAQGGANSVVLDYIAGLQLALTIEPSPVAIARPAEPVESAP